MKNKFLFLFLIGILVMACGALGYDEGNNITSITLTAPATTTWVRSTTTFSGAYVGNSSGNITVYNSSTIADGEVLCADSTLGTYSSTWSCSVDTSTFSDDCTGHTIYALYYNGTEGGIANNTVNGTVATIKFDNTAPSTPSISFDHSAIKRYKRNFYTCTSTDTCDGSLSYQVSLTDPKSSIKTNNTASSGDSAYFDGSDTQVEGTYTSYCSTTDDAGNVATLSSSTTFRVSGSANAIIPEVTEKEEARKAISTNLMWFLIAGASMIVLILFIFGGWAISQGKKKKSKKR